MSYTQAERRESTSTTASNSSNSTWRCHPYGPDKPGRGAMLFTGPDALRDHRVSVETQHRCVGENTMSPESTSEVDYLWRAPHCTPHPRPKSQFVGAVGWGIPNFVDWSAPQTGAQITLGEFRQELEDRHTHLYQNPWKRPSNTNGGSGQANSPSPRQKQNSSDAPGKGTPDRLGSHGSSRRGSQASVHSQNSGYSHHSQLSGY